MSTDLPDPLSEFVGSVYVALDPNDLDRTGDDYRRAVKAVEALRPELEELLALRAKGCKYVVTDGSTSHCTLAESGTAALLERLQDAEGTLRAENERLRNYITADGEEVDEVMSELRAKAQIAEDLAMHLRWLANDPERMPSPVDRTQAEELLVRHRALTQQEGT